MNKNKAVKAITGVLKNIAPGGSSDFDLWTEEQIAESLYDGLTALGLSLEKKPG